MKDWIMYAIHAIGATLTIFSGWELINRDLSPEKRKPLTFRVLFANLILAFIGTVVFSPYVIRRYEIVDISEILIVGFALAIVFPFVVHLVLLCLQLLVSQLPEVIVYGVKKFFKKWFK